MLIPASAGHSPLLIPLPLGRGSSKWLSGTTATVRAESSLLSGTYHYSVVYQMPWFEAAALGSV